MALTQEQLDGCRKIVNQLKHRVSTLEHAVDGKADENDLIHRFAECRASVNALFAEVTRGAIEPASAGKRPAWKTAAEKITRK